MMMMNEDEAKRVSFVLYENMKIQKFKFKFCKTLLRMMMNEDAVSYAAKHEN